MPIPIPKKVRNDIDKVDYESLVINALNKTIKVYIAQGYMDGQDFKPQGRFAECDFTFPELFGTGILSINKSALTEAVRLKLIEQGILEGGGE